MTGNKDIWYHVTHCAPGAIGNPMPCPAQGQWKGKQPCAFLLPRPGSATVISLSPCLFYCPTTFPTALHTINICQACPLLRRSNLFSLNYLLVLTSTDLEGYFPRWSTKQLIIDFSFLENLQASIMSFEGHRFKIIRFLSHFLESWNPVSKAVDKSTRCVLVGCPADKPCSWPTPAVQQAPWHSCYLGSLLPSRVTIFFERLNIFLKYLGVLCF